MILNKGDFKLNILISNDDGYQSKGINILSEIVSEFANVLVCAPEKDMSGSSSSITLNRPLKINKSNNGFYYVNGTPADCINLALNVIGFKPNFIFSGINHGANLGDDTLYSGTVAAAIEGYLSGINSISFSLNDKSDKYWDTAKKVISSFMQFLTSDSLLFKDICLLNVNIPNVVSNNIKGYKIVRLGRREQANSVNIEIDSNGNNIYWTGASGKSLNFEYDTDFSAVSEGFISITPLTIDLTSHKEINIARNIFENFKI